MHWLDITEWQTNKKFEINKFLYTLFYASSSMQWNKKVNLTSMCDFTVL